MPWPSTFPYTSAKGPNFPPSASALSGKKPRAAGRNAPYIIWTVIAIARGLGGLDRVVPWLPGLETPPPKVCALFFLVSNRAPKKSSGAPARTGTARRHFSFLLSLSVCCFRKVRPPRSLGKSLLPRAERSPAFGEEDDTTSDRAAEAAAQAGERLPGRPPAGSSGRGDQQPKPLLQRESVSSLSVCVLAHFLAGQRDGRQRPGGSLPMRSA